VAGKSAALLALMTGAFAGCGAEPAPAKSPTAGSRPAPAAAAQTPEAPSGVSASSECPDGMQPIPGGTLWMGSPADRGRADERPRHKRAVSPFCLDAREVTVADYLACVRNTICKASPDEVQLLEPTRRAEQEARSRSCSARLNPSSELPANCVSHADAVLYCEWKGLRLPTEIEWEWAASGGDDKLDYAWGASPADDDVVCWQARRPCFVGSKPAEAFGLHDLSGNLSEWTASKYGPYPNPAESGSKLAVRGGSFAERDPEALRSRRREAREPAFRDITLGFRCAKDR
jgi:formylglycine-generating enzyme required for sulfatase activity